MSAALPREEVGLACSIILVVLEQDLFARLIALSKSRAKTRGPVRSSKLGTAWPANLQVLRTVSPSSSPPTKATSESTNSVTIFLLTELTGLDCELNTARTDIARRADSKMFRTALAQNQRSEIQVKFLRLTMTIHDLSLETYGKSWDLLSFREKSLV